MFSTDAPSGTEIAISVLLVDDDDDDCVLTRDFLEDCGPGRYVCEAVGSFEAGLAALRKNHRVALVDYRLGARSGLELLQEAIASGVRLPIILFTGVGDESLGNLALRAGAADYLAKSQLTPALLDRTIRYALERRRTEEETLNATRERLAREAAESALLAREQLAAVISHDLKTPLTIIKAQSELLSRRLAKGGEVDSERILAGLQVVGQAANNAIGMLEELLDTAQLKIEGQQLDLRRVPTDLVALTAKVVDGQRAAMPDHHLELSAQGSVTANVDAARIERVLHNLLSNAVKYSPPGSEIRVGVDTREGVARIAVQDQGLGVPTQDLPLLFRRFHRGSNVAGRIPGTGLGLAGSRAIAEQHGGSIVVESVEGHGSTFTVLLPLN